MIPIIIAVAGVIVAATKTIGEIKTYGDRHPKR